MVEATSRELVARTRYPIRQISCESTTPGMSLGFLIRPREVVQCSYCGNTPRDWPKDGKCAQCGAAL